MEFGGWWLGSTSDFNGTWLSEELRNACQQFAAAFEDAAGQSVDSPAILALSENGVDGQPPSEEEAEALNLAVTFAVIHQNPYWTHENRNESWRVATTDNALIWSQPIDLEEGRLALERGGRVSTLSGGHRLSDEHFRIQSPLELHMPLAISLDVELLEAMYATFLTPPKEHEDLAATLKVAIRWLAKSWQNSPSIEWEDRLVFLKVATEALTGEHKNHRSAESLVRIFQTSRSQPGDGIGSDDLLWQPNEAKLTRRFMHGGKPTSAEVSQFEHWACALGDERNAIVHGDATHNATYNHTNSPYNGPFVGIADRVVREAIVVQLGNCGHPDVWRSQLNRAGLTALRRLAALEEEGR